VGTKDLIPTDLANANGAKKTLTDADVETTARKPFARSVDLDTQLFCRGQETSEIVFDDSNNVHQSPSRGHQALRAVRRDSHLLGKFHWKVGVPCVSWGYATSLSGKFEVIFW